jgi:hypothetical protein
MDRKVFLLMLPQELILFGGGISEELMSAYKRELAHVYRMASAKRMLFIKRKGTH